MKIISDIRLYKSDVPNIDGNFLPNEFAPKDINIVIRRIVMKLREHSFSLGDFDHLYINLTNCVTAGEIKPALRSVDKYHNWYRYYDIGISDEQFDTLNSNSNISFYVEIIISLLENHFSKYNKCNIRECINDAIDNGEQMLMLYKTKESKNYIAKLYLRLNNIGKYFPLLTVSNSNGKCILRKELSPTNDLFSFGEIQLNNKRVAIKPKYNYISREREIIEFFFDCESKI